AGLETQARAVGDRVGGGRALAGPRVSGGVDVLALADALVGQDETNGVIDAAGLDLVGGEQQGGDGIAGGVGAGALIAARERGRRGGLPVVARGVPYRQAATGERAPR